MRRIDNTLKGQVDFNSYLKRNQTARPKKIASKKIRIINFSIDLCIILLPLLFLIRHYLNSLIWQNFSQSSYLKIMLFTYLSSIFLYFFICEKYIGKTVGQTFTKTKVASAIGSRLTTKQILRRSLTRLIPFDFLTFLLKKDPVGLHDKLSKTYVIKTQ